MRHALGGRSAVVQGEGDAQADSVVQGGGAGLYSVVHGGREGEESW